MTAEGHPNAWQGLATITAHRRWPAGYHEVTVECPQVAEAANPGQFVHVLVQGPELLLRRPISIHAVSGDRVTIVLAAVGAGTKWLSRRSTGDTLDLIGPLGGRGLTVAPEAKTVALVGGGVGIPPLHFVAQRYGGGSARLVAFVGARRADLLLALEDFAALGVEVVVATDDGSQGFGGTVVGALAEYAASHPIDQVLSCGPTPMMRAAAEWAQSRGLPCQVCLEARMACGVGACLSCVVETTHNGWDRYRRVCTEGPVFDGDEIVWPALSPMVSAPI